MTHRRAVTLARIARQTGVSITTVSKVLNGLAGVSTQTRERVEAALAKAGYGAASTIPTSGALLELLVPRTASDWVGAVIPAVAIAAEERELSLVVSTSADDDDSAEAWMRRLLHRRPIGVIMTFSSPRSEHQELLRARNIPFVVLDPGGELPPGVAAIGSDNREGGRLATAHMIELGHRRIAALAGLGELPFMRDRLDGYREAHESAGIPVDERLIVSVRDLDEVRARAGELLDASDPPTAIVASTDALALEVCHVVRRRGRRIPHDVSIIGYDDVALSLRLDPPLTTIRQPFDAMAAQAVEALLGARRDGTPAAARLVLPVDLVVRGSTAPPRIAGKIPPQ